MRALASGDQRTSPSSKDSGRTNARLLQQRLAGVLWEVDELIEEGASYSDKKVSQLTAEASRLAQAVAAALAKDLPRPLSWTRVGAAGIGVAPPARLGCAAVALSRPKTFCSEVLLLGGRGKGTEALGKGILHIFDVSCELWRCIRSCGDIPGARSGCTATLCADGSVLVLGGRLASSSAASDELFLSETLATISMAALAPLLIKREASFSTTG